MKILVVDDEIASLKTLEILTQKLGYDVLSASDGSAAWAIWKKEIPRIVITDWSMPEMDGLELCSLIRKNQGSDYTYIIFVTANDTKDEIIRGLAAGADDYIIKPFNKEELKARIMAGERMLQLQQKDMLIFALAKLAEFRDLDTGNHLERVRHFCKIIAESILNSNLNCPEMDRQFINNLFLTSPMHDIGKVGIPDRILLKPGALNADEFEIMKNHTVIGFNALNEILKKTRYPDYLKMSADIALYHHEKYDGSGYPHSLRGEQIPLSARILALADVYDAITAKRIYKKAIPHEKAIAIIKDAAETHFDPTLIRIFCECEDQFIDIRKRFKDDQDEKTDSPDFFSRINR